MIDLNRENIKGFDVREFYVQLINDSKTKGFQVVTVGVFRCGNNPPVQPRDDKKALAKENLRV